MRFSAFPAPAALAALALSTLAGCGAAYQPSRGANFQIDREAEIDDDDIRKAFEAKPQMPERELRVSYYTFDPEITGDLDKTLGALPGVTSVYRIPPLLVTGQRRLAEGAPYHYYDNTAEVSVKKLRLLAARAHTDVLVIVDHGYRNIGVNPLVSLNMLLLPILFVPFIDTSVKGYAEAFVMDVRNGYLYGHIVEEDTRGKPYATIYDKNASEHAKEQWVALRQSMQKDLLKLVTDERSRKPAPAAPPPPPPPPASAPLGDAPPAPSGI